MLTRVVHENFGPLAREWFESLIEVTEFRTTLDVKLYCLKTLRKICAMVLQVGLCISSITPQRPVVSVGMATFNSTNTSSSAHVVFMFAM